jgi:myo-inositol-1(or 4)-monophosphatase
VNDASQLSCADIEAVIEIGQEAGRLATQMGQAGLRHIDTKSTDIDLVTEADLAGEELICTRLQQRFPGTGFWGEESNNQPDEEYFWLVDPIDGTVNYAHGVPYYAVNIGLNRRDTTLLSVTTALPAGHVYWARLGKGAYVRAADGSERRLQVNHVDDLRRAMLSTGFPYDRAENRDNNSAEFVYFMPRCQGLRRMGSAAIDMALVADGVFAAHWEGSLNPWDIAPGALIVHEAGGLVTDYDGNLWTPRSRPFIASNGQRALHQALVDGIRAARAALSTD